MDEIIRSFIRFVNSSYAEVELLLKARGYTSDEQSMYDWCQANWEILVERKVLGINEHLEVYGAGADLYGQSSRITDISALPTHRIKVIGKTRNTVTDMLNNCSIDLDDYNFEEFVGWENNFYTLLPIWKCVLMLNKETNSTSVVSLNEVSFELLHL